MVDALSFPQMVWSNKVPRYLASIEEETCKSKLYHLVHLWLCHLHHHLFLVLSFAQQSKSSLFSMSELASVHSACIVLARRIMSTSTLPFRVGARCLISHGRPQRHMGELSRSYLWKQFCSSTVGWILLTCSLFFSFFSTYNFCRSAPFATVFLALSVHGCLSLL